MNRMTARIHSKPLPPDLDHIRRTFAGTPIAGGRLPGKHAAVAIVLAGESADLHMCLIRRAEHDQDNWSGHMALPGGRVDPEDVNPRAAAIRETLEEVGLRLDAVPYLGALPTQPVSSRGRLIGMSLWPFVFHLGDTLEPPKPNDEVAAAYWVPLAHLLDPSNAAHRPTPRDGTVLQHPAVLYRGEYIWGLTYRTLTVFFDNLGFEIARPA